MPNREAQFHDLTSALPARCTNQDLACIPRARARVTPSPPPAPISSPLSRDSCSYAPPGRAPPRRVLSSRSSTERPLPRAPPAELALSSCPAGGPPRVLSPSSAGGPPRVLSSRPAGGLLRLRVPRPPRHRRRPHTPCRGQHAHRQVHPRRGLPPHHPRAGPPRRHAHRCVWLKPDTELSFLFGNSVPKSALARITENTKAGDGVVVMSMADVPLRFGVAARGAQDCRKADTNAVVVLHQSDAGEYLRKEEELM